ncbi:MAG: L-serine ammonia-lyase [Chitinophagales bacterium]|nr:L-serine ammonia-lyase [Chitinophagales bacterium]
MITTSFFELFKAGPGPSSSHTIGPMRAAYRFRHEVADYIGAATHQRYHIRIELYGALAATGHGHGTHRALLAGLLGYTPTDVDIDRLNGFFAQPDEIYVLFDDYPSIVLTERDLFFDYTANPYRHPNTVKFVLLDADFVPLLSEVFYSIGGGFIEKEGEPRHTESQKQPRYAYGNMAELEKIVAWEHLPVEKVLLDNEIALTGDSEAAIYQRIADIMEVMHQSVLRGLAAEGILPGGLNVSRRAKGMYEKSLQLAQQNRYADALFAKLNAYALAVSEENAAGQMVVTAPTNGAAGIIPACLEYLRCDCAIPERTLQNGLLIAAMVGFIIKDNASISGAELGCQAEVGSAAAMAAALFSYCNGLSFSRIVAAAEIAMEHHLGMTCDPIKGLVQIPCIERNANGAIKAYNAYLLADGRTSRPVISFDQVVEVMRQTGEDLSAKYKETASGGLATSFGWGNMPGS